MKAILYSRYGGPEVLRLDDVAQPTPRPNEVLVRVHAASLNPYDFHFMRGEPRVVRLAMGVRRPRSPRLGVDFSGVVESVGATVTRFKPGDAIFGVAKGALAEYACADESKSALKPDNITFEQAAGATVAGLTALQALRKPGELKRGEKVLINGAAGGVGTFAIQIAKEMGGEVTAVCSTRNVEMVRSIGADHVIDYTQQKISGTYDVILDNISNYSLMQFREMLNPGGRYVGVGGESIRSIDMLAALGTMLISRFGDRRMRVQMSRGNPGDMDDLRDLMAGGVTPVIDSCYPLRDTAAAMARLEGRHVSGKVIVTVTT